nr:MAG TPA_asm: hypothetical protein [Caudoviricetes sp.]
MCIDFFAVLCLYWYRLHVLVVWITCAYSLKWAIFQF